MQKCQKHPKYKGKRIPKHECVECLSLYVRFGSHIRTPIRPTKIVPDKSKYSRKRDKKIKEE